VLSSFLKLLSHKLAKPSAFEEPNINPPPREVMLQCQWNYSI